MLRLSLRSIGTLLPIVAVLSCGRRSAGAPPLFRLLSQAQTGVTFANTITTSDSVNVQTNVYLYNGAGVAVGDIDNDGLPDIFFNYNGDWYLDLFLRNDSPKDFVRTGHPAGIRSTTLGGSNRLYRNNGDGTFTDVSGEAGILKDVGYGLGVAVADLNGDGRPDIYVSNDVEPNDVLYVNNGDGTFTNKAAAWLKHSSFAGMGVDIADFNNDGRPDILQVEIMRHALRVRKRMSGFLTQGSIAELRSQGFRVDYSV